MEKICFATPPLTYESVSCESLAETGQEIEAIVNQYSDDSVTCQ